MSRSHLKILRGIAAASSHAIIDSSHIDWVAHRELWQSGCFEGAPVENEQGVLSAVSITGLTSFGWDTVHRLEAEHTSVGIIKGARWKVYAWFFGIVAAVIAGWLVWHLMHS